MWVSSQGPVYYGFCVVCAGQNINIGSFHVGHIIAKARGGDDTISNLTTQCMSCNTSMKDMDLLEYAQKRFGINSPEDKRVTQLLKKKGVYEKVLRARAASAMAPGGPPLCRAGSASDAWDAKIRAVDNAVKVANSYVNSMKTIQTLEEQNEIEVLASATATEAEMRAIKNRVNDAKGMFDEAYKAMKKCKSRKAYALKKVESLKQASSVKMSGSAGQPAVADTKFEKDDAFEGIEDDIGDVLDLTEQRQIEDVPTAHANEDIKIARSNDDIKIAPLDENKLCCRSMGEKLYAAEVHLHHVEEKLRDIEAQHAEESYILKQSLGLVIFVFLVCAAGNGYLYLRG